MLFMIIFLHIKMYGKFKKYDLRNCLGSNEIITKQPLQEIARRGYSQ